MGRSGFDDDDIPSCIPAGVVRRKNKSLCLTFHWNQPSTCLWMSRCFVFKYLQNLGYCGLLRAFCSRILLEMYLGGFRPSKASSATRFPAVACSSVKDGYTSLFGPVSASRLSKQSLRIFHFCDMAINLFCCARPHEYCSNSLAAMTCGQCLWSYTCCRITTAKSPLKPAGGAAEQVRNSSQSNHI